MHGLISPIRGYAWGSRSYIATVQGRPAPAAAPEAELWIGAHPGDPSTLDGASLAALIADGPAGLLGEAGVRRFGPRLPYLMKLLAAEEPLSLQAHPDAARAAQRHAAGYAGYVDPHHKPELLVAVEPFAALCGFRAPSASADLLAGLGVPALAPVVAALRGADGLRAAVTALLTWPEGEREAVVGAVAAACAARTPAPPGEFADPYAVGRDLAARYPGDRGVLVALLLNLVHLAPGEGVFMPAGNLHAYLRGAGLEIMAASDNVLRGGLTPKRVDVPELLRVLRFEELAEPVRRPEAVAPGVQAWPVPVEEFALYRAVVDGGPVRVPVHAPSVALCLRGEVTVDDGAGAVALRGGRAAFGAAGPGTGGGVFCAGRGEVWLAGPSV